MSAKVIMKNRKNSVPPFNRFNVLFAFAFALIFSSAFVSPSHSRFFAEEGNGGGSWFNTNPNVVFGGGGGNVTFGLGPAADTSLTPVVNNIISEDALGWHSALDRRRGRSESLRFGTFEISNGARRPFILQMVFENGGILKNQETGKPIRVDWLELRYRGRHGANEIRRLSDNEYRGDGFVYELHFLQEDVLELYEMELWGVLNEADVSSAGGGYYADEIAFGIEIIQ